ncbi:MAG TPA: glycoside hydrolase family 97 N-terminal domain-containing protein [Tepidisphaeraceae bacterium]
MRQRLAAVTTDFRRSAAISMFCLCIVVLVLSGCSHNSADGGGSPQDRAIALASPDGNINFVLQMDPPRPRFSVALKNAPVLEPSPIFFTLDGVDLADGAQLAGAVERYDINETYPYRGVHSTAVNRCNGIKIPLRHPSSNTNYTLEVRAQNDGIAFRTLIAGAADAKRTPDETTTFVVPDGSTVWHHDMSGHYEGTYKQTAVAEIRPGEWCAPPMTFKLPGGAGYAAITEANLVNYSGMSLECDGKRGFRAGLGHRQPVSTPYRRRYSPEDIERLSHPAVITGTITTPWRVVLVGSDLNTLVNSDLIPNCCPPPDPRLFPEGIRTAWVKPGRAVWRYTDGGENTLQGIRAFTKMAGELGFEYQVVEGLWHNWSPDEVRSVVEEARAVGVGIFVWEGSKNLRTPESQEAFFKKLHHFGIAGAKIDFFDHEHKETIDEYQSLLRKAAEYQVLLDFHGANKPAGEVRTWPNEMTREAIRGMEASRFFTRALHETTLPFTRFLAGHAEYTVVHFGTRRGDTSAAHQIATAAILNAGVETYSLNPQKMLDSAAVDIFKTLPSVWDETRVLPPSEIGEIAVYARRTGDTWFLAVANGPAAKSVKIPLSFLGGGEYKALVVKDGPDNGTATTTQPTTALDVENTTMKQGDTVTLDLFAGGGYIARFSR